MMETRDDNMIYDARRDYDIGRIMVYYRVQSMVVVDFQVLMESLSTTVLI